MPDAKEVTVRSPVGRRTGPLLNLAAERRPTTARP
jgi:hypothetical protein